MSDGTVYNLLRNSDLTRHELSAVAAATTGKAATYMSANWGNAANPAYDSAGMHFTGPTKDGNPNSGVGVMFAASDLGLINGDTYVLSVEVASLAAADANNGLTVWQCASGVWWAGKVTRSKWSSGAGVYHTSFVYDGSAYVCLLMSVGESGSATVTRFGLYHAASAAWAPAEGDSTVHNLLVGSWDLSTAVWYNGAKRSDKTFRGAAVADLGSAGEGGIYFPNDAHRADARVTLGAEYVLSFWARADVAGDRIHSDVWGSKYMLDTELTTEWQQVVMPYGIVNADHREIYIYGLGTNSGTVYMALPMCVRGTEPAAWAPAEGETLAGGGALMSANLLVGVKPKLASGATESDGIISIAANTGSERNVVEYAIPGQSALSANQTCHIGISLCAASGGNEWTSAVVEYADSAGNANGVSNVTSATGDGAWHRHELSVVVPSGMHVVGIHFNQDASGTAIDFANPTFSYGSPVTLATAAHTPYATQDHLRSEYATKASLKVTSDAVTAEVEERGKLAGRVGTLESTSGTHTSKLEQLATSIKSLVKGESTYTDPDGKSATSGIYSLVTQTRDSVTALFGSYTKTADLASTQAVKDAKKAGTDAQAAASAAQSTADSLATMIREDATGITVGKSADGKTYSTGRTHMDEDSFDILDKAGKVITQLAADGASFLSGLVRLRVHEVNSNSVVSMLSDFLSIDSLRQAVMRAGKETSGAYVDGYAAAIADVTGKRGMARLYCTQGDGSHVTANNAFTVAPGGYDLSQPEYLTAALLGTGGGGTGVTHFQEGVPVTSSLDTCGPGVFSYDTSTTSRPTDYGTCVCIRAGGGNWLFEFALPTSGDPHWRRNINGGEWTSWWVITSQ